MAASATGNSRGGWPRSAILRLATDHPIRGHSRSERALPSTQRKPGKPRASDERLAALYREQFNFVWRSLRRLGVPEAALEDLAQDVFMVAARRLDDFENRSSMRTWLFGIAMRVVRTRRRSEWRHTRKLDELARHRPASGDPLAQRDAQRTLLALLDELDDDKRAVYVLAELEGLTAVEIAEGLEANVNTVYTRLRAARLQLREAAARLLANEGAEP
jgi:RNA polymerase sigma-70 factor (ECF subfamily)